MNAIVKLVKVFICVLFFAGPSFTLIPEINASEQQKLNVIILEPLGVDRVKKMKPLFKDKDVSKELSAFDFSYMILTKFQKLSVNIKYQLYQL